jgi:tetratricopeptide (TPR) repeat protein
MFEDEDDFLDLSPLLDRYAQMQEKNAVYFFDVDEFEALSDHFYLSGKSKKALEVVNHALGQHPEQPSFFMRKAQIFTASNRIKEAYAELQKVEALAPESYDLFMARAALASKQEEHLKAISLYKKALVHAEFPDEVWPMIALEYQAMGDFKNALKYLKRTILENPDDEIAIYNIALCFDLLDSIKEGITYFKTLIDSDPYNELAWYHAGLLYSKQEEYELAISSLDYAILIDEDFTAAYYEKARLLEKTFRYQEAVNTYLATVEIDQATGFTYYKIGLCYLRLHKDQKALNYFTKAVHEDQDLDEAFFELSLLLDDRNEHQEAVFYINKALLLDEDNVEYKYVSAKIHKRAGLLDESEHLYAQILEEQASEVSDMVFSDYAELLFDLCEFDTGMSILYKGVELNPEADDLHYRLAGYLYTLKEADEATIYFKKAFSLNPDGVRLFFELFPKLKNHPQIRKAIVAKRQK